MSIDDFSVNFDHLEGKDLIHDWQWLVGDTKLPILITSFGDAFLQDISTGSIHFLNVGDGDIEDITDDQESFIELLSDKEFVIDYFALEIVLELERKHKILQSGQIYSFIVPPCLGGSYESANIEVTDISVHFSMMGQIYDQVRSLPEGATINDISFVES